MRYHARCVRHGGSAETETSGSKSFALTGAKRHFERARPFRIERMALDLSLDVPRKSVDGVSTIEIVRVDKDARELALDAVGFEIDEVRLRGKKVRHVYDGKVLSIPIEPEVKHE